MSKPCFLTLAQGAAPSAFADALALLAVAIGLTRRRAAMRGEAVA